MPIQPGDVTITYADITKSKKLLGYSPETSIEEGIRNFVEWYTQCCSNTSMQNQPGTGMQKYI